jgi:cytochrome o ubiquinol oxidase subunit IV
MANQQLTQADSEHRLKTKLKMYVSGFVLSIIFTLTAFTLVQQHTLVPETLYVVVVVLGLLQLFVQVMCFLRLNTSREEGRWNLITMLFTLIVMVIIVTGSLWIMYNLNYNMMSH